MSVAIPTFESKLVPDNNTSDVRPCATLLQRASRVWSVNEFLKPIRSHATVKGTDIENDANTLHATIRSNTLVLWNLHCCAHDQIFAYDYLWVTTQDRTAQQIRNLKNLNRLSFAARSNFCLEWMLKDIVVRFDEEPCRSFYRLAMQAVQITGLSSNGRHLEALTVVSKIRNTLHNRGCYHGPSRRFELEGVCYEFGNGEIVKGCASWDHVAHGLACALKSIRFIIDRVPASPH